MRPIADGRLTIPVQDSFTLPRTTSMQAHTSHGLLTLVPVKVRSGRHSLAVPNVSETTEKAHDAFNRVNEMVQAAHVSLLTTTTDMGITSARN